MSAVSTAENVEPGSAEDLWARLDGGDPAAIVAFFKGMPEKNRRSLAKTVKAHLAATRWQAFHNESTGQIDWDAFHVRGRAGARTQVPAAVATINGAAAIATYLGRVYSRVDVDPSCLNAVREVLTDREPSWPADLPDAVATVLGPLTSRRSAGSRGSEGYSLVTALAESAGVVPAASAGFVRLWAESYRGEIYMPEVHAAFLQDPRLAELLPLTFDDDLNDDLYSDWTHFRGVVLKAVEQGVVPRADMLDGSLRRLLRGGRGGAMRAHLKFWTALQPTDAEIVERLSSCISLLSAENGTVARSFLASVQRVADAGLIDVELALEAASIAVTRSEKGIVKSTLGWLDALADAHPERAGEIAGHLAAAFGAQAADLQERAVKLIGKRAEVLSEDDRHRLVAEAEVYLAPDLKARLAGLLGVEQDVAVHDAGTGYPDLAPYTPRPLLPAIESPAELAEVVTSLLVKGPAEAMVLERPAAVSPG